MKKKEEKIISKYLNEIRKKIPTCIWTKKLEILQVTILIILSLFSMMHKKIFMDGVINTFIFSIGTISITLSTIKSYRKSKKISITYLIGINIVSMICLLMSSHIIFNVLILWIRVVAFITLVILGLWVVWKAKVRVTNKFNRYLVISLFTVILNFGGIYASLYSMYFPSGQECFKIDQELSYKRVVMPLDFVYYSSDAFFGTEISDVKIKYIDYMDYYKEGEVISLYSEKHYKAILVTNIAKMFSLIESLLFIIYISMIVMNRDKQENS